MAVFSQEKRYSQKITTSHHQGICLKRDHRDGRGGDGHSQALAAGRTLMQGPGSQQNRGGRVKGGQDGGDVEPAGAGGGDEEQVAGGVEGSRGEAPQDGGPGQVEAAGWG